MVIRIIKLSAVRKGSLKLLIAKLQSTDFHRCASARGGLTGYLLKAQGYGIDQVVEKAADIFRIEPAEVRKPGNQPQRVKARNLCLLLGGKKIRDEWSRCKHTDGYRSAGAEPSGSAD